MRPFQKTAFRDSRVIFILSHMRSRSSLLAHILGSHPEVVGYSELHRSYLTKQDLVQLKFDISSESLPDLRGKYIVDKILHDSHQISPRILKSNHLRSVFLLRKPEATLKSLIHMSRKTGVDYYAVPENALDYYCNRLLKLQDYALQSAINAFFVESDELIKHTTTVLNRLTGWLELSSPLKAQYSIFEHTGEFGFGDPLDNIKTGTVVTTREHKDIHVPAEVLAVGRKSYQACKKVLAALS